LERQTIVELKGIRAAIRSRVWFDTLLLEIKLLLVIESKIVESNLRSLRGFSCLRLVWLRVLLLTLQSRLL